MSSVAEKIPETLRTSFLSAHWIWTPETDIANPPVGSRAFRKTYTTPTGKTAASALILITVDNEYSLFVNGQYISSSIYSWESAQIFNVAPLDPRSNLFSLNGTNFPNENTGAAFGAAGVLCAIQITFSDETAIIFLSDGAWKSFGTVSAGFESLSTDDSNWENSIQVAQYGSGTWGGNVVLPLSVPQQITISLTNPTASTVGSGAKTISVPFSTSHGTLISPPNPTASTVGPETKTMSVPFSTPRGTIISLPNPTASATGTETTTSRSITSAPATISSNSKVDFGATVGGVIGGLIIFILIVFLIMLLKRQKRMHSYGKKFSTESALALQYVDSTDGHRVIAPFSVPPGLPTRMGADVEMSENDQYDSMGYSSNGSISGHEHTNRWVRGLNGGWTETIESDPQQAHHKGPIVHLNG